MKIRSIDELEEFIASEYAWRRKELTNLRGIALSAKGHNSGVLLRSFVPIMYAHWEGFVKQISMAKLTYLISKGLKYRDLSSSFHAYAAFEIFKGQIPSKKFEAIARIAAGDLDLDSPIRVNPSIYIDTKSNLNSEVLKEISIKVCIDYTLFELKENLIDEKFLGLRNMICHGERVSVSGSEADELYVEVTNLIDLYKNEILNSVHRKSYLKDGV